MIQFLKIFFSTTAHSAENLLHVYDVTRDASTKFMKFMTSGSGVLALRWGSIGHILNICITSLKILSVFVKIRKAARKYFHLTDTCP